LSFWFARRLGRSSPASHLIAAGLGEPLVRGDGVVVGDPRDAGVVVSERFGTMEEVRHLAARVNDTAVLLRLVSQMSVRSGRRRVDRCPSSPEAFGRHDLHGRGKTLKVWIVVDADALDDGPACCECLE
jgi:hypothetical protein